MSKYQKVLGKEKAQVKNSHKTEQKFTRTYSVDCICCAPVVDCFPQMEMGEKISSFCTLYVQNIRLSPKPLNFQPKNMYIVGMYMIS